MIFKYLLDTKKFFPFFLNYFPGYGADFHYFGTILMGKKGKLTVNENCQLRNNKKIYIIDGSVLNFKNPSSFFGKSDEALNRINLNDPLEYLLIEDFKFLIPQSSL
mgnify:CR=1 FL=1